MNEWSKKRGIMRRYDLTAHIYDMRYAEEQAAKIEAALRDLSVKKSSVVLDVGCGTGILFNYITEKTEMIVGLDISRKTLYQAQKHAKNLSNVHLILADADKMPFRKGFFDYVFAVTLIQNSPNPAVTLKEIMRVAKRNAEIVVTGMKKAFTLEMFEGLLQDVGLMITSMKCENLKCYVAVCTRPDHH